MTRAQKNRTQRHRRAQKMDRIAKTPPTPQPLKIDYGHTPTHVAVIFNRTLAAREPVLLTIAQAKDMQKALDIVMEKLIVYGQAAAEITPEGIKPVEERQP